MAGCIVLYDGVVCWSDIDDDTTYLLYEYIRIQESLCSRRELLGTFRQETESSSKHSKKSSFIEIDYFVNASKPIKSGGISAAKVYIKRLLDKFLTTCTVAEEFQGASRGNIKKLGCFRSG